MSKFKLILLTIVLLVGFSTLYGVDSGFTTPTPTITLTVTPAFVQPNGSLTFKVITTNIAPGSEVVVTTTALDDSFFNSRGVLGSDGTVTLTEQLNNWELGNNIIIAKIGTIESNIVSLTVSEDASPSPPINSTDASADAGTGSGSDTTSDSDTGSDSAGEVSSAENSSGITLILLKTALVGLPVNFTVDVDDTSITADDVKIQVKKSEETAFTGARLSLAAATNDSGTILSGVFKGSSSFTKGTYFFKAVAKGKESSEVQVVVKDKPTPTALTFTGNVQLSSGASVIPLKCANASDCYVQIMNSFAKQVKVLAGN